jgi:hypothetical protein
VRATLICGRGSRAEISTRRSLNDDAAIYGWWLGPRPSVGS